jgi:hypothetical protein
MSRHVNERIFGLVASEWMPSAQDLRDKTNQEIVLECARRYIAIERAKRVRNTNRKVEQFAKVRVEKRAQHVAKVREIVSQFKDTLYEEWDQKILSSSFATGDGTLVTFRDATIKQHQDRAEMLEMHASEELITASLHRRAINDIRSSHALTLGGVVDALVSR